MLNFDNANSRRAVEHCFRTTSTMINPILSWTDSDVWDFLHHYGCESNPLYKCDNSRIGCIGCPMKGKRGRKKEFYKYPKYYYNYIRAFDRLVKVLKSKKGCLWNSGEEVMNWWILGNDEIPGQTLFDGFEPLDV